MRGTILFLTIARCYVCRFIGQRARSSPAGARGEAGDRGARWGSQGAVPTQHQPAGAGPRALRALQERQGKSASLGTVLVQLLPTLPIALAFR